MLVSRISIAALFALAGCSYVGGGELSASECSDQLDNDGDLLTNCEDPDCHVHAYCRVQVDSAVTAPFDGGEDAGVIVPPDAGTIRDAGSSTDARMDAAEPPPDDEDGGILDPPPDAGAVPCGGACAATQACIDEVCQDVSSPGAGEFELRIYTVEVPDFNAAGMCLDRCVDSLWPSFAFCSCPPDPYVTVHRLRGDERQLLGMTDVAFNDRSPDFEGAAFLVDLVEGDVLELSVWDADPQDSVLIYACRPDLRTLAPGPISCSDRVVLFLPGYTIDAELALPP